MSSDAAIQLEHVAKSFARGRVSILSDVNLTIWPGELAVLVGPSGSGKSTTLHLIAALEQPDAGRIRVDGREVAPHGRHLNAHRRESVGLVFQLHDLLPH